MKLGNLAMRIIRSRRLWLPAASVAALAVAATEVLRHGLLMGLPMPWYHIVSGLLEGIVVLVPLILYVMWRRAAMREQAALRDLQASEALREDMMHMLVHDLKSPLISSIQALSVIMRSREARCGEDEREELMFQIALESQQRLERMIGDILDIARLESGQMNLEQEIADMVQLAREAARDMGPTAHRSQIEIREHYCPDHVTAMVDWVKMRRVVDNLLFNAVKLTPAGGRISICLEQTSREVVITIRDTGPGIPWDLQERIFDKFAQAQLAQKGYGASAGLGLTFCKLAVEAHGGRIWVKSEPDEGSAFTFALPLESSNDSDLG